MASNSEKHTTLPVRVRFPPSPTGRLHIGNARTALFNWLFARKHNGVFVLRIEDTDKERSKREYEEEIINALDWLGLDWDEGIGKEAPGQSYRQSERTETYKKYLQILLNAQHAYYCYCTKDELEAEKQSMLAEGLVPKYGGRCRNLTEPPAGRSPETIRFKVPEMVIEFKDMIRDNVKFDMELMGDFVIAKDLESPLYNFAVVVDDEEMNITHVIRGEEHISNTPRQLVLLRALGFTEPTYAHLPLILNAQRSKLSKREADVSVLSYRDKGYLPEAIVNFLVLMGWHPSPDAITGKEQEVWTLSELIASFDINRVQKAGAVFNEEKLQWLNREHIKSLSTDELEDVLTPLLEARALSLGSRERLHLVIEAVRDRMKALTDFFELADFFFVLPEYSADLLKWKDAAKGENLAILTATLDLFKAADIWEKDQIVALLAPLVEQWGKGNVLWPIRAALSGKQSSPDPYDVAVTLGQEESVRRISKAITILSNASSS